MNFNMHDMSKYFRITNINRQIGNERSIATNDAPTIGINVQEVKIGPKKIVVEFAMRTDTGLTMEALKHEVAGILHTREAVRISFDDEPDKYYLGIITDDVDVSNLSTWFQKGKMTILVPDGVAHSTSYKIVRDFRKEGNKYVFDIENNGTVPAFPIITVKNNAENGYLGIVNSSGAIEIGNPEEADTVSGTASQTLFDYRSNISNALTGGTQKVAVLNDTSQQLIGTLGTVNVWGRNHIHLANRGTVTANKNNAGSITWTIPADKNGAVGSLYEYIWWRQIFWLGSSNQYGFIKLTVSDENGKFLYGVETIKRSLGLGCEYNFMSSDGKGGYKLEKRWSFIGTDKDDQNPFNQGRGWSDIRRENEYITVYWWGSYNRFYVPQIKGKKSAKVHVAIGTFGNKPIVTHQYLDQILYQKANVPFVIDIPNRFFTGSTIEVNSEMDTVTVNGLSSNSEVVDGSQWLSIPVGQSTLEVWQSSWNETDPTISINFEERFI